MEPGRTFEGQRCADLRNGTFINPIVPGDHADPTILKDGSDYYMTFSSFESNPGIVIWHSTDLVNWTPLGAALHQYLGSVWAMDLVRHGSTYYIYFPVVNDQGGGIYVIHAPHPTGPWSNPIRLDLEGCIDPGHAVGEDGKRYLFVNGIRRVELSDDGLSVNGTLEKAYEPWRYPEDWVVEMFAPEGPKIFRRGAYFYLVSAVGGTAGPATSHMVIVARSSSIHGPWQDCPHNPVVRTMSKTEAWWSRGHASLVEGPTGDWWMVSHGYEKDYRTLGRQTLLEPISWNDDGWPLAGTNDLSAPIPLPSGGTPCQAGIALSGPFLPEQLGIQWSIYGGGQDSGDRLDFKDGEVRLAARGRSPGDCMPLTMVVGDRNYEVEVSLRTEGAAQGGLVLYYSPRAYCGLGIEDGNIQTYMYGELHGWMVLPPTGPKVRLKLRNEDQVATWWTWGEADGTWVRHPWQMEVSGMNHNVFGGFTALKVGLLASGTGTVHYADFVYRGL